MMTNLLVMAWMLSLGFVPNSSLKTSDGSIEASNSLVQTLGVGFYLANCAHLYSTVEIQETKSEKAYFDPFRNDFLIGGSVYFKNVSVGISHECNHDIVTNTKFHDFNGWEAAFEKVYISYALPIRVIPKITITPSITLTDQFAERVRIKSNDKKEYFAHNTINISPNIFSTEFQLAIEFFYLRSYMAYQAGYATHNNEQMCAQLNMGMEIFYKNISLGLDYIDRKNFQKNAGYSLEDLTLFVRFRGKSSLL
jgi:hypothetical protein